MISRRSILRYGALAPLSALALSGCDWVSNSAKKPVVRLYLNWLYTASFAGDVLAARDFASNAGIKLDLQVGGEGRDPIKLVRDGDIGIASADEILRAIAIGAPIRIIGVLNDTHPAAFASLKASGIVTPKDFEGKRVGQLPFGATGLIYQALIAKSGIDRTKVKEVVITPDLRPFISGSVNDVQPIFMYDEPVSLEKQGVAYNIIDPRKYGVHFKGQCYFTTANTVETQGGMLAHALAALLLGWAKAADSPSSAIAALKQLSPALDEQDEFTRLTRALPFFVPLNRHQLLDTDPATWSDMIDTLVATKTIFRRLEASQFLALDSLRRAHATVGF